MSAQQHHSQLPNEIVNELKRKDRLVTFGVLGLILFMSLLLVWLFRPQWFAYGDQQDTWQEQNTAIDISERFIAVEQKFQDERLTVLGVLHPIDEVEIGAQVSGQLEQLLVSDGDYVKKGQVVAQIDPKIANAELRAASANLESAELQLSGKQRNAKLKQQHLLRLERLLKQDAIAENEVRLAREALDDIEVDLQVSAKQVKQQAEQVAKAEQNLTLTTIRSPIAGVVVNSVVKAGQTLTAKQTTPILMKVVNTQQMEIKISMTEAEVIKVKAGMRAWFKPLHSEFNAVQGVIATVLPVPDSMEHQQGLKTYTSIVKIISMPSFARIGMTVSVDIIIEPPKDTLLLSREVKITPIEEDYYWVHIKKVINPEKNEYELLKRKIKIGKVMPMFFEVTEGLKEGDMVQTK